MLKFQYEKHEKDSFMRKYKKYVKVWERFMKKEKVFVKCCYCMCFILWKNGLNVEKVFESMSKICVKYLESMLNCNRVCWIMLKIVQYANNWENMSKVGKSTKQC